MDSKLSHGDLIRGAALSTAAAFVYLGSLSRDYVFEGLFWAMPIDLGFHRKLCPGNYILYGPLGAAFHAAAGLGGFSGLAVNSLQVMDALLGAAGLFFFFLTLRELGAARRAALAWSAILGASLGYWRWSTDAEVYIFGAFLLQLNFFFCVQYAKGRGTPALLGALQALAVAGHIVNSVFFVVPIWFIVSRDRGAWRRPVGEFIAAAAILSLAAYGAAALSVVRPLELARAWHWFLGSANTPGGGVLWHGNVGLDGVGRWLRMTLNIFTSFQPGFQAPADRRAAGAFLWLARILLAAFAVGLLLGARKLEGRRKTAAAGCCLWLAAYACVFTSWEPDTMVYRVGDLPPLCVLLWLGYEAVISGDGGRAARRRCAAGAAVLLLWLALGVGNFEAEIHPRTFASNNPDLARMSFLKEHTRDGDWIAGQGGRDELYIPYFAQRRPLILDIFGANPAALVRRIDEALGAGSGVYVTSRVLADARWSRFFDRYRPVETSRDSRGFALYRLTRKS